VIDLMKNNKNEIITVHGNVQEEEFQVGRPSQQRTFRSLSVYIYTIFFSASSASYSHEHCVICVRKTILFTLMHHGIILWFIFSS